MPALLVKFAYSGSDGGNIAACPAPNGLIQAMSNGEAECLVRIRGSEEQVQPHLLCAGRPVKAARRRLASVLVR